MSSPGQTQHSSGPPNLESKMAQPSTTTREGSSTNNPEKKQDSFNVTLTHAFSKKMENSQQDHSNHEEKDPFTTPSTKGRSEQKLSATASAFQPFMYRMNTQTPVASSASYVNNPAVSPITFGQKVEDKIAQEPTANFNAARGLGFMGAFSTDTRVTRALRIAGIYAPISGGLVENCISVSNAGLSKQLALCLHLELTVL